MAYHPGSLKPRAMRSAFELFVKKKNENRIDGQKAQKTKGRNENSMLINDLNTLNLTPFTNHQHISGGFFY